MRRTPADHSPEPPFLIFLHIPKCAGSTFNSVMVNKFGYSILDCNKPSSLVSGTGLRNLDEVVKQYLACPESERSGYRYAGGHIAFGLHEKLGKPDARYLTFTRDPVQRYLSAFCYVRSLGWLERGHSFLDFLQMDYLGGNNMMVRQLNGAPDLDTLKAPAFRKDAAPVTEDVYRATVEQIERHFLMAAPIEMFDSALVFLAKRMGWSLQSLAYKRENRTPDAFRVNKISAKERKLAEELNEYDIRLHKYVIDRFKQKILNDGPIGHTVARAVFYFAKRMDAQFKP